MGLTSVIAAAVAAWVFGAVWYMLFSGRWLEAQGLADGEIDRRNPVPHVLAFLCLLLVAGMLRHVLVMAGISGAGGALVTGFGLGAFVALPWLAMGVLYAGRSPALIWIDGLYPVIGMALMGLVMALV